MPKANWPSIQSFADKTRNAELLNYFDLSLSLRRGKEANEKEYTIITENVPLKRMQHLSFSLDPTGTKKSKFCLCPGEKCQNVHPTLGGSLGLI